MDKPDKNVKRIKKTPIYPCTTRKMTAEELEDTKKSIEKAMKKLPGPKK
jgi:hypothetical protein